MLQIAAGPAKIVAGPVRPAMLTAQSGASNFALALSSMLVSAASPKTLPGEASAADLPIAGRQFAAEPGKDLPEIGLDLSGEEQAPEQNADGDEDAPAPEDLPFAWFALPTAPAPDAAPVAPVTAAKAIVAEPLIEIGLLETGIPAEQPNSAETAPPEVAPPTADAAPIPEDIAAKIAQLPQRLAGRAVAAAPVDAAAAPDAAPVKAPAPPGPVAAAAQPARHAPEATPPRTVASLIAQASAQQAAGQPITLSPQRRNPSDLGQPVVGSVAAPSPAALQQVAATPEAHQGALDMRRQEWMGKMVETIEAMREAGPIKETRITLMPDALGKVDILVRQDGEGVHVHFSTETQAARQILTEAQPRLNELAEQRGIRLGQTSVDSQSAGAQSGQRQNDARQTPSAPASARAAKDDVTNTDDERVA
ncbi:MAG: flagellar hook-length control protein FliK [Pseudomonadota bacterium]